MPSTFTFTKSKSDTALRKPPKDRTTASANDSGDKLYWDLNDPAAHEDVIADYECASPTEDGIHEILPPIKHVGTQCSDLEQYRYVPVYNVERFADEPDSIRYLTGFNSYSHLTLLYNYLLPNAEQLVYKPKDISPMNQMLLTLIKLRQNKDDIDLAVNFGVSRQTVSKIFYQWTNFMFLELSEINIWLDRETIDHYFPSRFQKLFPSTRVILDATEIPIEKPSNCNSQRMTFSTYKNRNTLKALIGISPRGQVTYISDCYGGSTSDRQIIERSDLMSGMLEKGDSIMSDRGIMVQDLFSSQDVAVNTPTTMRGRNQLPSSILEKDRKIASKRIHAERVIGYAKTFKILSSITCDKTEIANRIVHLCFLLTNFRECIVSARG